MRVKVEVHVLGGQLATIEGCRLEVCSPLLHLRLLSFLMWRLELLKGVDRHRVVAGADLQVITTTMLLNLHRRLF